MWLTSCEPNFGHAARARCPSDDSTFNSCREVFFCISRSFDSFGGDHPGVRWIRVLAVFLTLHVTLLVGRSFGHCERHWVSALSGAENGSHVVMRAVAYGCVVSFGSTGQRWALPRRFLQARSDGQWFLRFFDRARLRWAGSLSGFSMGCGRLVGLLV